MREPAPGEVWIPMTSEVHPRRVIWVGMDDCYGPGAVRWQMLDGSPGSMMQRKGWLGWVRKHSAECEADLPSVADVRGILKT